MQKTILQQSLVVADDGEVSLVYQLFTAAACAT
jgi:hypothetical protein